MRVQFGVNLIDLSKIKHVIKNEYVQNTFGFFGEEGFLFDHQLTDEQHELLVDYFDIRQDSRLPSGNFSLDEEPEPTPTGKFTGV